MHLRLRMAAVSVLFGATTVACGRSDGHVVPPAPLAPDAYPNAPVGPLGDTLSVNEQQVLQGVEEPVDVVRDGWGIPHIYARNSRDAFRAMGFVMASDRPTQMELLRRAATGRSAHAFGATLPDTVNQDIVATVLGVASAARTDYESLPEGSEFREVLEAFADGVSQRFEQIRKGAVTLPQPDAGALAPEHFGPWSATDSLAIARLRQFSLTASFQLQLELWMQRVSQTAAARFTPSALPPLARRAHVLPDLLRFAPAATAGDLHGSSQRPANGVDAYPESPSIEVPARLLDDAYAFASAQQQVARLFGGTDSPVSNAWAVPGLRSSSGAAALAADPLLSLASPPVAWMVHIEVTASGSAWSPDDIHAAGMTFVGVPAIPAGFNRDLAWASTQSAVDTLDLYLESLTQDASAVIFHGSQVPLRRDTVPISVQGQPDRRVDVWSVPHHGPVLPRLENHTVLPPDPSQGALSIRWGGVDVLGQLQAQLRLLRASNATEAREWTARSADSSLDYVFADAGGAVSAHYGAMRLILRDPRALGWNALHARGQLPCLVLPGDGSAEWLETLEIAQPALAPDDVLISGNADPFGTTFDNHPANANAVGDAPLYLGCFFDIGFRHARVHSLAHQSRTPLLSADDLAQWQRDVRSPLGARLVPHLLLALQHAREELAEPGTHAALTEWLASDPFATIDLDLLEQTLVDWCATGSCEARTGASATDDTASNDPNDVLASRAVLLFNVWLVHWMNRSLGDEYDLLDPSFRPPAHVQLRTLLHLLETEPTWLASFDLETRDSILWDDSSTPQLEGRDEQILRALLDALDWLTTHAAVDPELSRWGLHHTLFVSPLPGLSPSLRIPSAEDPRFPNGYARPGDLFALDTCTHDGVPRPSDTQPFRCTAGSGFRLLVHWNAADVVASGALAGRQREETSFQEPFESWRRGQTHPMALALSQVVDNARSRLVLAPQP